MTPLSDKANRLGNFIATGLLIALSFAGATRAAEPMAELDAWTAAKLMGMGVNIGNTLENTTHWETGWGNPRITKEYVESLAALGFKTVRAARGLGHLRARRPHPGRQARARGRGGATGSPPPACSAS